MSEPTYPIKYQSKPGVTLAKALAPMPKAPESEPAARQFPLAGQTQVRPLANPSRNGGGS